MFGIKSDKQVWRAAWGKNPYRFKAYRRANARWMTRKNKLNKLANRAIQSMKDAARAKGIDLSNFVLDVRAHLDK